MFYSSGNNNNTRKRDDYHNRANALAFTRSKTIFSLVFGPRIVTASFFNFLILLIIIFFFFVLLKIVRSTEKLNIIVSKCVLVWCRVFLIIKIFLNTYVLDRHTLSSPTYTRFHRIFDQIVFFENSTIMNTVIF